MNANAIQEKILSDARTSASDIMRDANEKAARLRDAAEKRMAAAHSRLMMQASEDAEAAWSAWKNWKNASACSATSAR